MGYPRTLAATGLLAAGFGLAALPASAEQRTITVTLLGGKTITIQVPAGTPLDQVKLPEVSTPILSISEGGAPAPAPAPQPGAAQPQTAAPSKAKERRKARSKRRHRRARERKAQLAVPSADAVHEPAAPRRPRPPVPPSPRDATYTFALPGPAPVGVPNFFIDKFRIPPFLLPIYQAAGIQYGIRWEILAAINEIETDYGRNLNVSSAGAVGWMQFMPATWRQYGVDANDDDKKDPYNPVDAIFAAARYLKAAGAEKDISRAIFAYNHADWYVDSVLMRARLIGGLPADLVGSLTGLTQGRFPVAATSRYVRGKRATNIFARRGAAVVAVQDGKIVRIGRDSIALRDVFGNTYAYGRLAKVSRTYVVDRKQPRSQRTVMRIGGRLAPVRERLQANPRAVTATKRADERPLRVGSRVPGGTVLGRIGGAAPHVRFAIRPVGKGAPLIDPKPILDGWKLLESTAIYRAKGKNPLIGKSPSIGQILLMSKAQLQRRVLADPRIEIYEGGREDIRTGQIDRRVLATLEFLAASGLKPTVSSLKGNHGYYTKSGNVSHHSSGNAVDISKINGIPVIGHQGDGSITDIAVRRLLTLQGTMKPAQIISLMSYTGVDNAISMPDHADHIHVGFQPKVSAILEPGQWIKLIDRLGSIDNPVLRR